MTSFAEDIDELIEWATYTVGEDRIEKKREISKKGKMKIKKEAVSFYGE